MTPSLSVTQTESRVNGRDDPLVYDEALDPTGQLRPPYAVLAQTLGCDPRQPPSAVAQSLHGGLLGDDTKVVPMPLALDEGEWRDIQAGVAQRAQALRRFFVDVVLGEGSYLSSGGALSASLFDEIASSEETSHGQLRARWRGQDPDQVRFTYAADLVRDSRGRWLVLEDNVGCVGGCADSYLVLDAYRRATGLSAPVGELPDLGAAVTRWLSHLGLEPSDNGVIALLSDAAPDGCSPQLREGRRRAQLVQRLGVRVVDEGAFARLCERSERAEPGVAAVLNLGGPSRAVARLLREVVFGRLRKPCLNPPGTGILGSKALLPFVVDMIRFYSGEQPLLDSPATALLRDGILPRDPHEWVVKTAAGCQGTGVSILREQTPDRLAKISSELRGSWPERATVAQRYVEPSRLSLGPEGEPRYVVELRAFVYVLGVEHVFAGEQAIAKLASSAARPRLHNISRGAAYAPVVPVRMSSQSSHASLRPQSVTQHLTAPVRS